MSPVLREELLAYGPANSDLSSIDTAAHPGVAEWVRNSYHRFGAESILWMRGYRRFSDVFEHATRLDNRDPAQKLADPWYLVGLREEDFSPVTRGYIARIFTSESTRSQLTLFINTFHRHGNLPDNFREQVEWAGGRSVKQTTVWTSWVMGVLGRYAGSWKPENVDELIAAGVKRRELDHVLSEVYGVSAEMTRNMTRQVLPDVPYTVVRAVLIEGMPIEYARAAFV